MVCITKEEAAQKRKRFSNVRRLLQEIDSAKEIITTALSKHTTPVVTFSGGKDSLVVLDLVRSIRPETTALFVNTGNEYTETVLYARSLSNIIEVEPEMPIKDNDGNKEIIKGNRVFWKCVEVYGFAKSKDKSTRHGNACCFWLKEKPLRTWQKNQGIDLVFTGLTSAESRQRMMTLKRMGYYYHNKQDDTYRCHPIHDWTEQDVWDYINLKQLKYNPIYDMGLPRCGCRFCTAYLSWKKITSLYNEQDTKIIMRKQGFKVLDDFI